MPAGAVIGAAAIGAGSSLLGARSQSRAAERSADSMTEAARLTTQSNERMLERQIGLQEPFRQLGVSAINPLADLLGLDYQSAATTQPNFQAQDTSGIASFDPNTLFRQPDGSLRPGGAPARLTPQGFDTQAYLDANPDVRAAFPGNGVHGVQDENAWARLHYHNYGRQEGRQAPLAGPNAPAGVIPGGEQSPQNAQPGAGARPSALEALQDRPGYNFRFSEGQRALDSSAAARGMTMSGANIKAQTRYGQDYASNEYDREINRLLAVMGGGQVATSNQQSAIGHTGALNQQANLNAGNARASAYQQQGQAWANGINGVGNAITGGIGAYGGIKGWFD